MSATAALLQKRFSRRRGGDLIFNRLLSECNLGMLSYYVGSWRPSDAVIMRLEVDYWP
jgi:hypothetical protein